AASRKREERLAGIGDRDLRGADALIAEVDVRDLDLFDREAVRHVEVRRAADAHGVALLGDGAWAPAADEGRDPGLADLDLPEDAEIGRHDARRCAGE